MTTTILIILASILAGMAISVKAFGTGSKKAKVFKDIYFSAEDFDGIGVVYTKQGEYSAIIDMENPVQKHCADMGQYYEFQSLFSAIVQALGEGYCLHKQDIFVRRSFGMEEDPQREYLSQSYFEHFQSRQYMETHTRLVITQENRKNGLLNFDKDGWQDFKVKIRKVIDLLKSSGVECRFMTAAEARDYVDRFFSMDFISQHPMLDTLKAGEETIDFGDRQMKTYSLVDVDCVALPSMLRPYSELNVNNSSMPVDIMSPLSEIPGVECVVYNQMVFMPSQRRELSMLEKKKNRHSSLPSPANLNAAEDIKKVQEVIARESKMLAYCHFNIMVTATAAADMQKPTNYLENQFGRQGIHISKRSYNQLELFINSFPGNAYRMSKDYDRYLTLTDAATCLMYKESMQRSEDTPLKIYYTDRQGVPVSIDITGKEGSKKLTDNSNFFCLGPSGSGKSFHMNSIMRQLWEQGTDVVMVDTGNSYEGLCEYVGGKYISYTEEKPITMNPFNITKEQSTSIEKINFLKNLVLQIWLGSQAPPTRMESSVAEQLVSEYYDNFFNGPRGYSEDQRRDIKNGLLTELANMDISDWVTLDTQEEGVNEQKVDELLDALERRRLDLNVEDLSFNSFYDFAVEDIAIICMENCIPNVTGAGIRPADFRKQMRSFYRGGKYERTLNEQSDSTLFDQTFIVFEIDAIKDDPTLFPIVTLIIMDVFLQKMRLKKNRKVLVIEEAWKAIATPLMADYIKYLYKTARKFWATVGVVTQELQDIIGSPIVKEAIINNSDVTMLLDQSKFKERFSEIKAILGLTDVDCKKIFTINRLDNHSGRPFFREVFVRRGSNSAVLGVEEPKECYMTYTTERMEKDALKLYKAELGCSHSEAIRRYVADWNASGISGSLAFAQKVSAAGRVLNLKQ